MFLYLQIPPTVGWKYLEKPPESSRKLELLYAGNYCSVYIVLGIISKLEMN